MDWYGAAIQAFVSDPVAHPGDLQPQKGRFAREQLGGERVDRFADLEEANPNGVEDEPVGKITSLEMGVDSVDPGNEVLEALPVAAHQSAIASAGIAAAMPGLRSAAGTRSTGTFRILSSSA